ncbi:hypothetical protein FLONG3_3564 [Fusarium longipes]|uniref:F-box domain-containing protein n=1 Tax=Fusarium longipes TaxID=694270 RepID=A0A395T1I2_9HYPO|nr:hypothetical protein FLONG3_3564 [Fusarium longipes]
MPSTEINNDSFILRIPNEILRICFELVAQLDRELATGYNYYDARYSTMKERKRLGLNQGQINVEGQYALALTCRRFHALVMPILYTTVCVDAHEYQQEWTLQKDLFFRTIDENPALQLYIKDLKVEWDREKVNGEIIRSLVKLPRLECLALDLLNLDPGEVDLGPTPEEKATANFAEIGFRGLRAKPEAIKRLMEWPRNLHTFDLGHMICDDYDWEGMEPEPAYRWDHDKVTDVLMPQRQSLRVLRLGWLGYTLNQNAFSTWECPQLQKLTLCITYEPPTYDACLRWLSPSLKTLVLDFHYFSIQQGSYSMFTRRQYQKARRVARWAKKIKAGPGCGAKSLERIGLWVLAVNSEYGQRNHEWDYMNGCDETKNLLIYALEKLEKYGFKSFWIAPSGAEYTAEDIKTKFPKSLK